MKLSLKFIGFKETRRDYEGAAKSTGSNIDKGLDTASKEIKDKMAQEAPKGLSGRLSKDIKITIPEMHSRKIGSEAENIMPGNRYSHYVEVGTGPEGGHGPYVPNVESIGQYYGVKKEIAWAIALSIARKGTPPNPFVGRTYEWAQMKVDKWASDIGDLISLSIQRGY